MTNSNQPAYPYPYHNGRISSGLTKREKFAAMALQGLLAATNLFGTTTDASITRAMRNVGANSIYEMFAKMAVAYADRTLAELAKTQEPT